MIAIIGTLHQQQFQCTCTRIQLPVAVQTPDGKFSPNHLLNLAASHHWNPMASAQIGFLCYLFFPLKLGAAPARYALHKLNRLEVCLDQSLSSVLRYCWNVRY